MKELVEVIKGVLEVARKPDSQGTLMVKATEPADEDRRSKTTYFWLDKESAQELIRVLRDAYKMGIADILPMKCGWGAQRTEDKLITAEKKVAGLNKRITVLDKTITVLDKTILALRADVVAARTKALAAEKALEPVRESLNRLTAEHSRFKRKLKRLGNKNAHNFK